MRRVKTERVSVSPAGWRTRRVLVQAGQLVAVLLIASATWLSATVAAKPCQLQVSASATFMGAIHNDTGSPYVNGVDGVECVFFNPACSGSGDLIFDTNSSNPSSVSTRTLCFDFTQSLLGPSACTVMADTLSSIPPSCGHGHLSLQALSGEPPIYTMPNGSELAQAWFADIDAGIHLHFSDPNVSSTCATPVLVQRSGNTWTISATAATNDDLAAVYQTIGRNVVLMDSRHVQFQLIVTVP